MAGDVRFDGAPRLVRASLSVALLGAIVCLGGLLINPRQLIFSYLAAFAFAVSVAVGALIFLMICNAMRAGWPISIRRLSETITSTLPLLALLFLPIIPGMGTLYSWLHPDRFTDLRDRQLLIHKAPYLNVPFFVARTVVYFAVWILCASLLRRWSLRNDADPATDIGRRLCALSAAMLPAVGLTVSFAAFDWLMSLAPTWYSTMFPVYYFAGGFVGAIALLTMMAYFGEQRAGLPRLGGSHYYALGRLLLAFTIFWAYVAFFQFLLIWIANKPDEVTYFLDRFRGPWRLTSMLLVFGKFVIPFVILLNYRIKRMRGALTAIAGWILAAQYIDVHWMVIPAFRAQGFPYHWLDFATLAVVVGLSVAFAARRLRGHPVVAINDPRLDEAYRYSSQ